MTWLRILMARSLGAYLRRFPEHPGRWRLAVLAVRLAPALRALQSRQMVKIKGVGRLLVDGSSQTGRMLLATGEYERGASALFRKALSPGSVMVDVGANIGYFSVLAAGLVGPRGQVFAFEPSTPVRERLLSNVRLNGLDNVHVRSEALGDGAGRAMLYTGPADDTGLASVRPLEGSRTEEVSQAKFDDLWDGQPVRLVKIDVEGAELRVLAGMEACVARDRPDIILEVTDEFLRAVGDSAEALFVWLSDRGYQMHEIGFDGSLRRIDGLPALGRCPPQFNAFCSVSGVSA